MSLTDSQSTGNQFIVTALIHHLLRIVILTENDTGIGPAKQIIGCIHLIIDLVESHPVLYLAVISFEAGPGKLYELFDRVSAQESVVSLGQFIWHFKV